LTRDPRVVAYVIRESPETGIDEVVVVDDDELDGLGVEIIRELGEEDGTRFVHALLAAPVADWDDRWATLTLDYNGPFADLLVRQRAVAYVTRERAGRTELLTIEEEGDPDRWLQVPAGRLDHGETLEEGLLRELAEETGFTGVRIVRELPDFEATYRNYSHNHAFHLVATEESPDAWRHEVHGHGTDAGFFHLCRWLPLTPDLKLWGARDPMLAKLRL
jgi:8-oxo-dGTP pyrophosphatase MutT (NUDIX family)